MTLHQGRTCVPCRKKKVKCDGNPARCGPCQRSRKQLDCVYDHSSHINNAPRLSNGQACRPCGQKKKRCDGARPYCGPCRVAQKGHGCTYSEVKTSRKRPDRIKFVPSKSSLSYAHRDGLFSSTNVVLRSAVPVPSSSHIPSDQIHESNRTLFLPPSKIDMAPHCFASPTASQARFLHFDDGNGYFGDIKPSNLSSSVIVQKHPSFPVYDPFLAAISEVSPGDLKMKFRFIFLSHHQQHGFRFMSTKVQAILLGDTTNTFIHPFFIHFAHMFGCNLYQEREKDYYLLGSLDVYIRLTLEALTEVAKDDPFSFAQACLLMALYLVYNNNARLGARFLNMAIDTVKRNDIRFVSPYGFTPQDYPLACAEDVLERTSVLCDLMYSEVMIVLLLGEKMPELLLSDLGRQFQQELPAAYPDAFRLCPIVLRMGTVLLVTEAARLLCKYERGTMPSSSWFHSCDRHLSAVTSHIANALFQVHRSRENNEIGHCVSLQYTNFVLSLTLAEISEILDSHPLWPECGAKCKSALHAIAQLLDNLCPEDMEYLFEVMGAHWTRVFLVFGGRRNTTTRSWYPARRVPPRSIFANASIFLIANQNKFANVHLSDALPVCRKLEDYLQHLALKQALGSPCTIDF